MGGGGGVEVGKGVGRGGCKREVKFLLKYKKNRGGG